MTEIIHSFCNYELFPSNIDLVFCLYRVFYYIIDNLYANYMKIVI